MKLKSHRAKIEEKLDEFELWVTPTMGEIRDTHQYEECLNFLIDGFELLSGVTQNFASSTTCSPKYISDSLAILLAGKDASSIQLIISKIASVLLLATGKTDNNLKCQFPIMLKNDAGITTYSIKNCRTNKWEKKPFPHTIDLDTVAKIVVCILEKEVELANFLNVYFHLIISDQEYANQVRCLGGAYRDYKNTNEEKTFLAPLTIFQSRGSITAVQGHIPETMLRCAMSDWGLKENYDYNHQDVSLQSLLGERTNSKNKKERKFDFVLPYRSRDTSTKLFIQSQFYAGDSGSVSHKVVDQTDSTRTATLDKFPNAIFLEYLDGAGYAASLRTDLRKMLSKRTTKEFFQVRTAPVKLRRELQEINFLTPLEVEHAILRTDSKLISVMRFLEQDEGYSHAEVEKGISDAIGNQIVDVRDDMLHLNPERIPIVRKYCLLDIIANFGGPVSIGKSRGCLIVPGYKVRWGMQQVQVVKKAVEIFPKLKSLWKDVEDAFSDLQDLINLGFVKIL